MSLVDVIIPTFDNPQFLIPCIKSLVMHTSMRDQMRIIIVNNGAKEAESWIPKSDGITLIQADRNLGWEGGLKKGLEVSDAPFVCFMNDDTYVPLSSFFWMHTLLSHFSDPSVAAVGPSSNVVMGAQNVFLQDDANAIVEVPYLIGFCMVIRRADLDAAGGIDDTLPGGDDIDLSIRLRGLGKRLMNSRAAFVYHHGFKTGTRVNGKDWNSQDMTERTNIALIRKHGFKKFFETLYGIKANDGSTFQWEDTEGNLIREYLKGDGKTVLEMGCGGNKTIATALGVDRIPTGEKVPNVRSQSSQADIVADVSEVPLTDQSADIIIARHILEHMVDPVRTLREWRRLLKDKGTLILALPDHRTSNTIPLNAEHVHAYTPDSAQALLELMGFKLTAFHQHYNGVSFISVFEKNGHV